MAFYEEFILESTGVQLSSNAEFGSLPEGTVLLRGDSKYSKNSKGSWDKVSFGSALIDLSRPDKILASSNIHSMEYKDGNLVKINYSASGDDFETFEYDSSSNLVQINHNVDNTLKGRTILTYQNDALYSSTYESV